MINVCLCFLTKKQISKQIPSLVRLLLYCPVRHFLQPRPPLYLFSAAFLILAVPGLSQHLLSNPENKCQNYVIVKSTPSKAPSVTISTLYSPIALSPYRACREPNKLTGHIIKRLLGVLGCILGLF